MAQERPTLRDWLGIPKQPDYSKARWLGPLVLVLVALLWGALFLSLAGGMFWVIFQIPGEAAKALTQESQADLRWYLLSLTALTAAIGAVIALPFTVLKTIYNRRQTETAEQGHITDQINKAVENLGAENETVRIGGLFALYNIYTQKPELLEQVSGILSSHVRRLARNREIEHFNDPIPEVRKGCISRAHSDANALTFLERRDAIMEFTRALERPTEELELAVNFLGRIPRKERLRLDLTGCNFQKIRFVECDFSYANFTSSRFDGATFHRCSLFRVSCGGSRSSTSHSSDRATQIFGLHAPTFFGATFFETTFEDCRAIGAVFDTAVFLRSIFKQCDLTASSFIGCQLKGATFTQNLLLSTSFHLPYDHSPDSFKDNFVVLSELPGDIDISKQIVPDKFQRSATHEECREQWLGLVEAGKPPTSYTPPQNPS